MKTKTKINFASDNYVGVHPKILKAIEQANQAAAPAYGYDEYTVRAVEKFRNLLGKNVEVFFVFNGTAANVLGLSSLMQSFEAVICAETAHINTDECGAPEKFIGCKLITVPTDDGKLTVENIQEVIFGVGTEHYVQAKVISITQTTEMGTVYTAAEIKTLAEFAHKNNMLLHMDGARIANAVVSLNVDIKEITAKAGVDVLSFGGTKNGLLLGEAIIFFDKKYAQNFKFVRKQAMQLASKMRFIAAQFEALLSDNLWLDNAKHANQMTQLLLGKISTLPQLKIMHSVQANAIFATLPSAIIEKLQQDFYFYVWNEKASEVRWMTSFATSEKEINLFAEAIGILMRK